MLDIRTGNMAPSLIVLFIIQDKYLILENDICSFNFWNYLKPIADSTYLDDEDKTDCICVLMYIIFLKLSSYLHDQFRYFSEVSEHTKYTLTKRS